MTIQRLLRAVLLIVGAVAATPSVQAVPSLEVYGRLPETELAAMSPSGKRIALVATVKDQRRLIVLEDGKVILSSPFGDQKVRTLDWAGEDKVLMRVSRTEGIGMEFYSRTTEVFSMIVVPIGKGPIWAVFERDKEVFAGVHGFYGLSGDGDRYGYFGGVEASYERDGVHVKDGRRSLYRVDLLTGSKAIIARQPEFAGRDWQLGPDGRIVATLDYLSERGAWEIRTPDRKLLASGNTPSGDISIIGLGRTPGTLAYYIRMKDEEAAKLMEVPAAGGTPVEILSDERVRDYIVDPRSQRLIGYVTGDGNSTEIRLFDPQQQKIMAATAKAFPGLSVSLKGWNQAFDRLLVRTSGSKDAGTWWLVDRTARSANVISLAYAIEPEDVGPISVFDYKAGDGLAMSGVLTLPPDRPARNLPVILLPHGGPQSQDDPEFDWWAQAFASRGYAVFQPNFRGSTGFGRDFQRAGWGEWGRKMQSDISDGLTALAKQGIVNPKRACIMGGSYGGYAALAGVTLQQGFYRCAVSVAGVGDVAKLVDTGRWESGDNAFTGRFYRQQIGTGRNLSQISPVNFAAKADAPILLIHGIDDIIVPFDQSKDMAAALTRAGKPFEFVRLDGEDHWLSRGTTRLAMLKAAAAFIEKHNPPDPPPPPAR